MMDVLRRKLHHLARGDEGVALVVTLALFMFLYVSCAGVFSVGRAVKERIILQNAVDAAAYSAAMIEADTLSRIATINRAMAWTYKSLVFSQMNWIALKTLSESREKYLADWKFRSDGTIAATEETGLVGKIGICASRETPDASDAYWPIGEIPGKDDDKLEELEGLIDTYSEQLEKMAAAVDDLTGNLVDRERQAVKDVLEANLPTRIGDLCRFEIKSSQDYFKEMSPSEEATFVRFAYAWTEEGEKQFENEYEDFREWFALDESADASFTRRFTGKLQTFWTYWNKAHVPVTPPTPDVRAEDYRRDDVYEGYTARPRVLEDEYLPDGQSVIGHVSKGAITVAVVKKNENPWQGMTDCNGFYSAFDYSDATEWSVAIASAQAGYRDRIFEAAGGDDIADDGKEKRMVYSLLPVDYDTWIKENEENDWIKGPYWNLASPDWNAVFLPVRKAFMPGSGAGSLAEWMNKGTWERVATNPQYVSTLEEFQFSNVNRLALPRMHNNDGSDSVLGWGSNDFLDLFYH